jgi:hypothetical protein
MSSPQPSEDYVLVPRILIQSASPSRHAEKTAQEDLSLPSTQPKDVGTSSDTLQVPRRSLRKRSATEASLLSSDSESPFNMGSGKKESERSSKKHQPTSSKSSKSSKSKTTKTDEWQDVTDPEERRRIQNRLAQRKFRMFHPSTTTCWLMVQRH